MPPEHPTHEQLDFAHPVELADALSVSTGADLPILGYHFVSDSVTGDFWIDGGLSADQFLAEIEKITGTAPEVVGAYVDGASFEKQKARVGSRPSLLGANLPVFDAPDPDPSLVAAATAATSELLEPKFNSPTVRANDTWQPTSAEVQIGSMGDNLSISQKYDWYGLDPFATPQVMADHWGMEFQIDFYTIMRPPPVGYTPPVTYGIRPWCGPLDYKDWAAASNKPFDWFGWVISGTNLVAAPGGLGLYGDYNDLSDPCDVSTIGVGMAAPWGMPSTAGATNHLSIYAYPLKGQDTQSKIGAIVQPVSRSYCEWWPSMPLTDCMGVQPDTYPGPGSASNRMVLNDNPAPPDAPKYAPNLCWYSPNYGLTSASVWSC